MVEERILVCGGAQPQPIVMQRDLVDGRPILSEWMQISVAWSVPVAKFNPELEGRLSLANDIVFVDAEHRVESPDRRNGRLPNSHRTDIGRFDDGDVAGAISQHV